MERNPLAIAAVAGCALLAGPALAQTKTGQQNYPVRPIRIIVPGPAGSSVNAAIPKANSTFLMVSSSAI